MELLQNYTYPEILSREILDKKHPNVEKNIEFWDTLGDLVEGGFRLYEKRRCYVERRPDEEDVLYNKRLKKFVYTNILGDAIRDFVVKLTSSPMYSKGLGDDDFWLRFRKSVNGKNKKEKDFINNLFKMLLTYGHCYVFVDKPTPKGIIRNRLEERLQKIDPYCVLYKPEDIIDYGIDDNDSISWVKIYSKKTISLPTSVYSVKHSWVYIDSNYITTYEYLQKNKDEELPKDISRVSQISHKNNRCPVLKLELPHELWTGNNAFLKSIQYLQIENGWTDTASLAGYIQRIFTPSNNADSPNETYEGRNIEIEDVKSSNAHIMIGSGFEFKEAQGSSLKTLSHDVLDKIERQIKSIVSLDNVTASPNESKAQSGVSKSIDYAQFHDNLKRYGEILTSHYENILLLVASIAGKNDNEIEVSGLTEFDLDIVTSTLENAEKVSRVDKNLTETAKKLYWKSVAKTIIPDLSNEDEETINIEYEFFSFSDALEKPSASQNSNDDPQQSS